MSRYALFLLLSLNLCSSGDETLSGYGASDRVWVLQSINDTPFPARATIQFPGEGKITGEAPCNRYFGAQTAPYPWFKAENIASTKRACPDLTSEATYLKLLSEMTISEVSETTLILSNDAQQTMVFVPN